MQFLLAALLLISPASAEASDGKTITKVVRLLEDMMAASKTEGEEERTLYAKYKCYCDTNEAEKKEAIAKNKDTIGLLENQIEELRGSNAKLSTEVAKLKADMEANVQSRTDAQTVRDKEAQAYADLKKDLDASIIAMGKAIETLADVGADQTLSVGADHTQYMAGYSEGSLIKLKSSVKQALIAASAVMSKKQASTVASFVQAPFTGTYTSQSGEVVGILKDMKDTFERNLDTSTKAEDAAITAHGKFMEEKKKAHGEMKSLFEGKQENLSNNDSELSTKTSELEAAQGTLAEDQTFLEQLLDMCKAKSKQYEERTLLRTNEEAAIAQAVAILNSDAAFATFGTVSATSTGGTGPAASFLQVRNIKKHGLSSQERRRESAKAFLRKASAGKKLPLLSRALALLQANNPFSKVLDEIAKMLKVIDEEESADTKQHDWCVDERKTNNDELGKKKTEITSLEGSITSLTDTIEDPVTGLKVQIAEKEASLETNTENKKSETKDRTEDNLVYQKNIKNLVEAQVLLTKAVKVLKAYYAKILDSNSAALIALTRSKDPPAPPGTWDDAYVGQSSKGGDAVSMIEFILDETKKEETAAHDAERESQHKYEDSMQSLMDEEKNLLGAVRTLRSDLETAQGDLLSKEKELASTTKDKEAIEAYLEEIKAGCDFIVDNLADRQTNRANEKKALEDAREALKGTPAYITAVAEQHTEDLGECATVCKAEGEAHVKCKACLAKVTVPGYCAGHADTQGC